MTQIIAEDLWLWGGVISLPHIYNIRIRGEAMNLRAELKHSLVKQIIFRIDYDGLMETDTEQLAANLRDSIYDAGYIEMDKRQENQIDVQVKMDLNGGFNNNLAISNTNNSIVYIFRKSNNEVIEINKSFFTLTINFESLYTCFDKYVGIIVTVISAIKNMSKYFRPLRIGLRKINICFLRDINLIPTYFMKAAFNTVELVENFENHDFVASNAVSLLMKDDIRVNYVRNLQKGVIQLSEQTQEEVYQLVIDIDAFIDASSNIVAAVDSDSDINKTICNINETTFDVFIRSLTDDFVEKLKQEVFDDTEIDGVIINE